MLSTKDEILQKIWPLLNFDAYGVAGLETLGLTRASVLIIIHYRHTIPYIILTKRSGSIRLHSSEICFPGGRYDPVEDRNLLDTAIRETTEELGLALTERDIIGSLRPVRTLTSNFIIHPFVTIQGMIARPKSVSKEVERIIDAPLYKVLKSIAPDHRHSEITQNRDLYKFKYKDDIIWGATSQILKQLHDHLYEKAYDN
ncbi:MAG: CoA pyrophosphatase [Nitrososphaeraceae archaeon]|jgi:8-oxo-dGTP pyrophosphatase MutT (NUDIX family)